MNSVLERCDLQDIGYFLTGLVGRTHAMYIRSVLHAGEYW